MRNGVELFALQQFIIVLFDCIITAHYCAVKITFHFCAVLFYNGVANKNLTEVFYERLHPKR